MKRLAVIFGTALLVLPANVAGQVRADFFPNWTYTSTPSVPGISVNGTSPSGGANVLLSGFIAQPGSASIPVLAYETQFSSTTPIDFNSTFSLALKITDDNNSSGTLNFTGSLNGTLTQSTSGVVASFAPVSSNSITFDGHTYTVTIQPLTLQTNTTQQDIFASVAVANGSSGGGSPPPPPPPPHTNGTPEPTSLLLAGLGLSCFGAQRLWKRRRLTQTIAAA